MSASFNLTTHKLLISRKLNLKLSLTIGDIIARFRSPKVTNCTIKSVGILKCDGFAKNYMESRPESKKCDFFI